MAYVGTQVHIDHYGSAGIGISVGSDTKYCSADVVGYYRPEVSCEDTGEGAVQAVLKATNPCHLDLAELQAGPDAGVCVNGKWRAS
jgi:hypothetical protein